MMRAPDLTAAWLAAARDERISLELESVYAYTAAAIESRSPACWASGRCCSFEAAGHRLYVTGLEAAYTIANLQALNPGVLNPGVLNPGVLSPGVLSPESTELVPRLRTSGLKTQDLLSARAHGGCPFQAANLCAVHTIKPLGCRVYFCDRSAQEWQHELTERALEQIRAIHARHAIEYRYGEWRDMLAHFTSDRSAAQAGA
jgi:Fe-S-cluster containining protein